tara:strand:+ start:1179 stop:1973 length:795 start_codon:yes stop_codon:yes gene_type:complete
MNLNDLQSNYETKISRINRWLEETYGFKVYDQVEVEKLFQIKDDLDIQREKLKASLPFNSYHTHSEYAKNILLSEAIVLMIGQLNDEDIEKMQGSDEVGHEQPAVVSMTKEETSKEEVTEEQDLEKAETVLASQQLVDEFQGIVEDLGKMQNETLGALVDKMTYEFGADVAAQFNNSMMATIDSILEMAREAKEKTQNEVLKLQGEQPATDMSNADSDDEVMADPVADDEESLEIDPADSDVETDGDEAASGPEDEPLGRAKKD